MLRFFENLSIQYLAIKFVWALASFLIPRRRPLEVVYGRARYCLIKFNTNTLSSTEECLDIWNQLFELFDSNSFLAVSSLYGKYYAFDLAIEIAEVYEAGYKFYEFNAKHCEDSDRKVEIDCLAKLAWSNMKLRLESFIETEPLDVKQGAIEHCYSLKTGKHYYICKGIRQYPIFQL